MLIAVQLFPGTSALFIGAFITPAHTATDRKVERLDTRAGAYTIIDCSTASSGVPRERQFLPNESGGFITVFQPDSKLVILNY